MIEGIPLQEIEETNLQQLINAQVPESRTLDYKRDLEVSTPDQRKEFLADISSFANASGGHLIIGIDESGGIPTTINGVSVPDPDAEVLRLENIIRTGIDPRIPGLETRAISLSSGDYVLIFRIPQSWISPHMVTLRGTSRFFSRNSAGKYQLDVTELRNAFILSESASERIRNFRIDRINKIMTGDTPVSLEEGAKEALHLVPLQSLSTDRQADLDVFIKDHATDLYRILHPRNLTDWRHNFDGILIINAPQTVGVARWYIQLFRNGITEFVGVVAKPEVHDISYKFERNFIEILPKLLEYQHLMQVQPPIISLLSMVNVNGYTIAGQKQSWDRAQTFPIDRDVLAVPEIIIEDMACDPTQTLKPLFDPVWNAAGWPRSMNYQEDGSYSLNWGR